LVGNLCETLALLAELAALFEFDELMKSSLPGAICHHASRVLVNDLHFAARDNVMLVLVEEMECCESLPDQLLSGTLGTPDAGDPAGLITKPLLPPPAQQDLIFLGRNTIVLAPHQGASDVEGDFVTFAVGGAILFSRDDRWGSRLVNQNAVGLVHDTEVQTAK